MENIEVRKKDFIDRVNLALSKLQDASLHNWDDKFLTILESIATSPREIHYIFAVQKQGQTNAECFKIGVNEMILAGLSKYIEQDIRTHWTQQYLDRRTERTKRLNRMLEELKNL